MQSNAASYKEMKCKSCKRKIPENAIFCCWCGSKQLNTVDDIRVPTPIKLKSGAFSGQLMVDGERVRVVGKTEQEYRAKCIAARNHLIELRELKTTSLYEAIDSYINSRSEVLSASTIRGYRTVQRYHFTGVIDIRKADWQKMINAESKTYSPKTMKNAWRLVQSVLKENHIESPSVVLPQQIKKERSFLTPSEIKPYIESLRAFPEAEVAALLALHSLRQSEILYLSVDDVNIIKKTISVNGATVPDEHNQLVRQNETKTVSSRRTIPILIPRLYEILSDIKNESLHRYIVTAHPSTIRRQLIKINPDITLHSLRHTFASLAYSLGISELECMKLGGWSSSSTMRDIYTHLAEEDKSKAVESLLAFYLNDEKAQETQSAARVQIPPSAPEMTED